MFKEIFLFDLKQNFRKPGTYVYFGLFFVITLLVGLVAAGVFDLAAEDSNLKVNSAHSVADILIGLNNGIFGLVNSVILVAIMATGIQKDYEYNTHPLYFTKPIHKNNYFFGRFFSAFLTALFVFSGQLIGFYIGCLFGLGKPQVGPFELMNFLQPFLIFSAPNILLLGIIFFAITTFSRNTLSAYLFCIILLVINFTTSSITSDLDNKLTAAIWEPFGGEALGYITQYWTPDDQNTRMIPLEGALLYNRALWLLLAILITFISYTQFKFSQFLNPLSLFKRKEEKSDAALTAAHLQTLASLPKVSQHFSGRESIKQLFYLAKFEFLKMAKSPFFIIVCALGLVMMLIVSQYMGAIYDTQTYPVTYQVLESVSAIFEFFIIILIVFFAGNTIWREREQKTDELVGATPVSNTTLFFSKYLGLIYITLILFGLMILTGMTIQASKSYFNFEVLVYLKTVLGFRLISLVIIIGLCLFIQVILPNKYLGFFICLIPILFLRYIFGLLQWNNNLYIFNSSGPQMPYSDMNGFGHIIGSFIMFKTYWLSIILFLCLLALAVFARGKEKGLKARFRLSKYDFNNKLKLVLSALVLLVISTGSYIYYNTNVLHTLRSAKEQEQLSVDFEKKFKRFEKLVQPRIVASNIDVAIYPKERNLDIKGFYYLKNKSNAALDTLFINYNGDDDHEYVFRKLLPNVGAGVILDDLSNGVKIFKLATPLQPGDSLRFDFEMTYKPIGFRNNGTDLSIVNNGTFFNNMMFPSIGYNANAELGSNVARKKYGLKKKPRMAAVNDSAARMNTYISKDADWIRFETTVSTDADQIAIAPGYLEKEWTSNGRRFYKYKMDSPILNFYSYLSADYQIKKDKWKGVNIEIYYHKGHEYNLDRMINSIKKSLDYYTTNFGPYQHRQVRILEFPRYASFAQSFPNTIPYSESIGFVAKVDEANKEAIDVPFYITAHEVAHQWWAHQVIGGDVQGSPLMSESMSQYAALMVMEQEYGKPAMKKFLKYEMDKYLRGRTFESKKELPLMLCENQDYIHYSKGSVVMYALQDYLGAQVLNKALSEYLNKVKFQEPPYTNSIEFVNYIRAATPDSLKYIIHDMFETITLYENYVKDLTYVKTADHKYKVKLTLGSAKFRSDSLGKNAKIPVADYMDIGIFGDAAQKGSPEKELLFKRIKMTKPEQVFEFIVNEEPKSAGIDPYHKLIDRTPENNNCKFGTKPPKVNTDVKDGRGSGASITINTGD